MKVQVCVKCLSEGRLSQSLFTSGYKRTKFNLCLEHKDLLRQANITNEMDAMRELLELEGKGIDFLNSNLRQTRGAK